jgi:UDP-glucose 4-epimerase
MSNSLITGGAGFLGANVLRAALNEPQLTDERLIVLDDLSGGYRDNLPDDPRVEFVQGSITDDGLIERLFDEHQFRYVYHLAAYAAEGLSHFIRRFNYTNNLLGSATLINAAIKYRAECFVFTSSIAVYGAAQVPMTEDTIPNPEDPYGIAKYAVELDLKAAHELFGLDYVIFRPHNVYGEYQNIGDKYRNVVGIFMNRLLQGKSMPVFGDGEQQRAFTYVGDVAGVLASAPLVPAARNQLFNLGAERPCSVNELAQKVAEALNVPADIEYLPRRHEVDVAFCNHAHCKDIFGSIPETSLEEGLQRMASWVQKVGSRESSEFTAIEITDQLPDSWKRK